MSRALFIVVSVFATLLVAHPTSVAQGSNCGLEACSDADTGGGVDVETPGEDGSPGGDGNPAFNPDGSVNCALYAEHPTCQSDSGGGGGSGLPACVYENGVATNEPCQGPTQPCVAFPTADPDAPADPNAADPCGGPEAIVPPYIPPPTAGEIGQEAEDNIVWPVVDAHPRGLADLIAGGDGQILAGGFEHSLVTWGYEDWVPLEADASITKTVVVSGVAFSETFTATLVATPVEVRWDTGPNNNAVSRHNPPTSVTCDGPGNTSFHEDTREFQDWQSYSAYGGSDCKFVWWGMSDWVGSAFTMSAEIEWDLVLTTNWDGAVTNIGVHLEQYSSGGWWIDLPSAVNVNEGGWESIDRGD